jgi:hypothetical protein
VGTRLGAWWGIRGKLRARGYVRETRGEGVISFRFSTRQLLAPVVAEVLNDGVLGGEDLLAMRATVEAQICEMCLLVIFRIMTVADVKA